MASIPHLNKPMLNQSMSQGDRNNMRILMADSNELLLGVYRKYLQKYGFQVSTAYDASTCVATLREVHPDVLVLDPELFAGSGSGIRDLIFDEPEVIPPIVIALVSANSQGVLQRISDFPVDEVQFKPLLPEELCRCIYRHDNSHGVLDQRHWIEEIEFEAETALAS